MRQLLRYAGVRFAAELRPGRGDLIHRSVIGTRDPAVLVLRLRDKQYLDTQMPIDALSNSRVARMEELLVLHHRKTDGGAFMAKLNRYYQEVGGADTS